MAEDVSPACCLSSTVTLPCRHDSPRHPSSRIHTYTNTHTTLPYRFHFGDIVSVLGSGTGVSGVGMVIEPVLPRTSSRASTRGTSRTTRALSGRRAPERCTQYMVLVGQTLHRVATQRLWWKGRRLPYRQAKMRHLFCQVSDSVRQRIRFDDVSLYSVTDQHTAKAIATFCSRLDGIGPASSLTDGTACIGGNTLAFARVFARVHAIELDPTRHEMLVDNLRLLLDARHAVRVKTRCADYTAVFAEMGQDVVFLDPPWGGKTYKRLSRVELALGKMGLGTLCHALLPRCRYVVVKVPLNFDALGLAKTVGQAVRVVRMTEKVMLVVLVGSG